MTKIFIVRHGRSAWNKSKRVSGQLDPPLCEEGFLQAARLADALSAEPLTAIYTSDLRRAVYTALPIAKRRQMVIRQQENLREQHLGIVQGRFRDHRDPEACSLWEKRKKDKLNFRIPGGETYFELRARVRRFLQTIENEAHGSVLIIGHRNTNRALFGLLLENNAEQVMHWTLRAHYLYEINLQPRLQVNTISLRERDLGRSRKGVWL